MDFRQVSEHLLKARGHFEGSDVYVSDGDGGYNPVTAVEVQEVNGRSILVLETDALGMVVDGDTWDDEPEPGEDDPEKDPPGQTFNPTGDNIPGSQAPEGDPNGAPLPGSAETSPHTEGRSLEEGARNNPEVTGSGPMYSA